ncbi:MAG: DUF3488 and transglutaminase-like domain-containing protein [Nitrospirota bacterium]
MERSSSLLRVADLVTALTYAVALTGFVVVLRYTGVGYSALFLALYLWALQSDYRRRTVIPRWAINSAALLLVAFTFFRVTTDTVVPVSLEALLLLTAIKLVEEKRFRDHLQVYLLAALLLAGSALMTLDMIFLAHLIGMVFLVTLAMIFLTFSSQDERMELPVATVLKIASRALVIPLLALPIAALLFMVLPRTSYPLFSFFNRGSGALSGFSDHITLGEITAIQEDTAVAFRARVRPLDERLLYWRGIVLDQFDGMSWRPSQDGADEASVPAPVPAGAVEQTVFLEPHGQRYLFALDKPVSLSFPRSRRSAGLVYEVPYPVAVRIKYDAVSALSAMLPDKRVDKEAYVRLPVKGFERTRELVEEITRNSSGDAEKLKALLGFLQRGGYRYSLTGLPATSTALEDFLFTHKYGNCEYFASALAVMLRCAAVPSRIVGGYRGGHYNEVGGYYAVLQSSAHVWVEAYIEGSGWVRVDPTPAALPGRARPARSLLLEVRLLMDTISYFWNAAVINYNFDVQRSLAVKMGAGIGKSFASLVKEWKGAVRHLAVAALFSGAAVLLYRSVRNRRSREERLMHAFLKRMQGFGYAKAASEGLEEFAAAIPDAGLRERTLRFVKAYEAYYYRDTKLTAEALKQLKALLREL